MFYLLLVHSGSFESTELTDRFKKKTTRPEIQSVFIFHSNLGFQDRVQKIRPVESVLILVVETKLIEFFTF